MSELQELIKAIGHILGPTSGLDCDEVDHNQLIKLMEQYISNEEEWARYNLSDPNRNYTRNLVDETNGKSNVLIVCWNPGKGSPIHDHANAHCVMKLLKGGLRETLYEPPSDGVPPKAFQEIIYEENQVTYISDKIGLHKIENASTDEPAVSLHLYTPPHAANYGFHLFDEISGKKSHIKTAPPYSMYGQKIEHQYDMKMAPISAMSGITKASIDHANKCAPRSVI